MLMLLLVAAAAGAAAVVGAAGEKQPVQLCGCARPGTPAAAQQTWDWGTRATATGSTSPSPIRLRTNHSLCLHAGVVPGRSEAHALFVAECTAALNFSFVPTMKRLDARDTSVLEASAGRGAQRMCVDADSMSDKLQLWSCIDGDNDQQYAGIDGVGVIVDQWTGFSNCV